MKSYTFDLITEFLSSLKLHLYLPLPIIYIEKTKYKGSITIWSENNTAYRWRGLTGILSTVLAQAGNSNSSWQPHGNSACVNLVQWDIRYVYK